MGINRSEMLTKAIFLCIICEFARSTSFFNIDYDINDECFGHSVQLREPCGNEKMSEQECLDAGCCHDSYFQDAYNCFQKRIPGQKTCAIDIKQRIPCLKIQTHSQDYVSKIDCYREGCCYDDTSYDLQLADEAQELNAKDPEFRYYTNFFNYYHYIPKCYKMQEINDQRCSVPNEARKPCDRGKQVSSHECLNSNCCWNPNVPNTTFCYEKDLNFAPLTKECQVEKRETCGEQNQDDERKCLFVGCCYDDSKYPHCFMGKVDLKAHQEFQIKVMKSTPISLSEITSTPVPNMCWKNTYGRGVGKIPGECPELQKQGLLCYPKCKPGYRGLTFVCWQDCPTNYVDTGAFCFKPPPYGRGFGYPWKFGDALNNDGMLRRCNHDHKKLGCEMWGLVAYPKCKPGFHPVGCCICSPDCRNGQVDIGISCAKKSYVRETILPSCPSGEEYDFGLCYKKCYKGYNGVGPVCWGTCPSGMVDCGLACADTQETCGKAIFDQVFSAVDVIANIAMAVTTGGAGNAAKTSATMAARKTIQSVSKKVTKDAVKKTLRVAVEKTGRELSEVAMESVAMNAVELSSGLSDSFALEEFDPTGIAGLVEAYNHPICKYNK